MTRSISGGILNIDKPHGMTSMQVVRRIKRAGGFKRVGHAGTLDPIATGVLPVCFGQATRMMEYLLDGAKRYSGEIHLGVSTDTYDAVGEVVAETDASAITSDQVRSALMQFQGEISQVPPMYSRPQARRQAAVRPRQKGHRGRTRAAPGLGLRHRSHRMGAARGHRQSGLRTRLLHALAGLRLGRDTWLRRPSEVAGCVSRPDRFISTRPSPWRKPSSPLKTAHGPTLCTAPISPWRACGRSSRDTGRRTPSATGDRCPPRSHFGPLKPTNVAGCTAPMASSSP